MIWFTTNPPLISDSLLLLLILLALRIYSVTPVDFLSSLTTLTMAFFDLSPGLLPAQCLSTFRPQDTSCAAPFPLVSSILILIFIVVDTLSLLLPTLPTVCS